MIYDIIGDIHGQADKLIGLLTQLGYVDNGQYFEPPANHRAFFIGDLVDRGPQQLKTLQTVFAMVDAGVADIVMGNHEYNAIAYATLDNVANDGSYLRAHNADHDKQHKDFLAEIPFGSAEHDYWINRFYEIPLWIETEFACFVHACWDVDNMAILASCVDHNNCLTRDGLKATGQKGTPEYDALERVLKGVEALLPNDLYITDKYDIKRYDVRISWWLSALNTRPIHEVARVPDEWKAMLKDLLADAHFDNGIDFELRTDKPIFVGHYWFTGEPQPLTEHVVCTDYSAGVDGFMTCYQLDTDSQVLPLSADNFVQYIADQ